MLRVLFIPAAAILAAWLCPPAPARPELKPAPLSTAALRRSGIEAERAGRWQEARAALEKALQAEPNEPETLYALGVCLAQSGDPPAALRDLAAALKSGFQDYRALESDAALNPLRGLPDFAALSRH